MVRFDPPELEKRWEEAIQVLEDVAELKPFDADEDEDVIVTEATEIEEFSMASWDDTIRCPRQETSCRTPKRTTRLLVMNVPAINLSNSRI